MRTDRRIERSLTEPILVLAALAAAGPPAGLRAQAADSTGTRLTEITVHSKGLEGNLLGDPSDQPAWVYLPPSYPTAPDRRYPVLYLLHGYGGAPRTWLNGYQGMELDRTMDSLIRSGASREMIVVVPNGRNKYDGSMYLNSTVTGNWEDYLVRDLVGFVDGAYRTIASPRGRGIAGHSMGGYGALVLAMRNPEVYGSTYALSPCCLGLVGNLTETQVWRNVLRLESADQVFPNPRSSDDFLTRALIAIAAAFSPNPARPSLPADFPYRLRNGRLIASEPAMDRWRERMPLHAVDRYQANLKRIAIALDYGENEAASHIRLSTAGLSAALAARGIPHQFEVYPKGDHGNLIRERFEAHVVPFFSRVFAEAVGR